MPLKLSRRLPSTGSASGPVLCALAAEMNLTLQRGVNGRLGRTVHTQCERGPMEGTTESALGLAGRWGPSTQSRAEAVASRLIPGELGWRST